MFWFKKKQKVKASTTELTKPKPNVKPVSIDDFTIEVTDQNTLDLVSVITSCVLANNNPQSKFKIKRISTVDHDKEMACVLVAGILAQDHPTSTFKVRKIEEVK